MSLVYISYWCICFNICGPTMTSRFYRPCLGTFLSFRPTGLLATTSVVKEDLENFTGSFFPHLVEFVKWLPHISGIGLFFLFPQTLLKKQSTALCSQNLLNLAEVSIVTAELAEGEWGEPQCRVPSQRLTSVPNFIVLLSILKSFFSLTFKHGSSITVPSSQFCCFDMDFRL